jgi:hypothetical protein
MRAPYMAFGCQRLRVTPPKSTSTNPVVSLAIHPVKSTCDQMDDRPSNNVKVNAKEGE